MTESKEYYKACNKADYCKTNEVELDAKKSLLKYYEEEDCNNIFTSRGRELLYNVKFVFVCLFWAVALLTLVSLKKTLDNIDARMHNAPSVTTK
jgi:hypothetical protein